MTSAATLPLGVMRGHTRAGPAEGSPRSSRARPHTLHVVLQHEAGVGGSLVASLLAQYHETRSLPVRGFDLAPLTPSVFPGFARYGRFGALGVRHLAVRTDRGRAGFRHSVGRALDALLHALERSVRGAIMGRTAGPVTAVADVGAAASPPLLECWRDEQASVVLAALGVRVVLHAVAPAELGVPQDADVCDVGHVALAPDAAIVVWRNDGPTSSPRCGRADGRPDAGQDALAASPAVRYHVAGVVHVPTFPGRIGREWAAPSSARRHAGHGVEHGPITDALVDNLPLAEALGARWPDSPARRRLRAARDDVFAQLARALGDA